MPKQVWEAADGTIFETEEECLAWEKLANHLRALMREEAYREEEYGDGSEVEKAYGMKSLFGWKLKNGFDNAEQLIEYRESFHGLVDLLNGKPGKSY